MVDGHSNDNTEEICRKYKVKFILDNKLGKGDAQSIGVSEVINEYVIFVDGDGFMI